MPEKGPCLYLEAGILDLGRLGNGLGIPVYGDQSAVRDPDAGE